MMFQTVSLHYIYISHIILHIYIYVCVCSTELFYTILRSHFPVHHLGLGEIVPGSPATVSPGSHPFFGSWVLVARHSLKFLMKKRQADVVMFWNPLLQPVLMIDTPSSCKTKLQSQRTNSTSVLLHAARDCWFSNVSWPKGSLVQMLGIGPRITWEVNMIRFLNE